MPKKAQPKTICGAKSKSTGKLCQRSPMANGRCMMHGGTTPPHQPGKNVKHGIYARVLSAEDAQRVAEMPVGTLEHEIRLARWQLEKAVEGYAKVANAERRHDGLESVEQAAGAMELDEVKDEPIVSGGDDESGPVSITMKRSTKWKRPDFRAHIDRLLKTIANLEESHARITGGLTRSPEQVALDIQAALRQIDDSVGAG